MKKCCLILLIAALLMSAAHAEQMQRPQRDRTIWLEGVEENIVESCYAGKFGYTIWVDESVLQPAATEAECDMYFEAAAEGADVSVLIDFLDASWDDVRARLAELTAGYPQENLGVESQYFINENLEYFTRTAQTDDMCHCYYLVRLPQGILKIVAEYPAEAAEGYGVRIDEMIQTIEFPE